MLFWSIRPGPRIRRHPALYMLLGFFCLPLSWTPKRHPCKGPERRLAILRWASLTEYLNLRGNDWRKSQENTLLLTVTSDAAEEKWLEFFSKRGRGSQKDTAIYIQGHTAPNFTHTTSDSWRWRTGGMLHMLCLLTGKREEEFYCPKVMLEFLR